VYNTLFFLTAWVKSAPAVGKNALYPHCKEKPIFQPYFKTTGKNRIRSGRVVHHVGMRCPMKNLFCFGNPLLKQLIIWNLHASCLQYPNTLSLSEKPTLLSNNNN